MKKLFALLLCLVMIVPALALAETEITLWTYPIGSWSKSDVVDEIVANFNAVYPDIKVEYLDYTNGDDRVTTSIEAGTMQYVNEETHTWTCTGMLIYVFKSLGLFSRTSTGRATRIPRSGASSRSC